MRDLSIRQRSFIDMMTWGEEHARHGFSLLSAREDFDEFFDHIAAKGLFEPAHNLGPISVDEKSVRIPYWNALDYLTACATRSRERSDLTLAAKVLSVMRAVTAFREADGSRRENFHTSRSFAKMLGELPPASVNNEDIDMARDWLDSGFAHDMVGPEFDKGALARWLASEDTETKRKAVRLLKHCLAVKWKKEPLGEGEEPVPVIDGYWLNELVEHHAPAFGKTIGGDAAIVFRDAVAEVFGRGGRREWSYIFRPAVEDHEQNQEWHGAENATVGGLRDVVLNWLDAEPDAAIGFCRELLDNEHQMLRRVGIYLLDQRWDELHFLYTQGLKPSWFDLEYLHELYGLLKRRFETFNETAKSATVNALHEIQLPKVEDRDALLKRIQARWLSAIAGTGFVPVKEWIAELGDTVGLEPREHADFNSYIEVTSGPGPSAFEVQELIKFVQERIIAKRLAAVPKDSGRGMPYEALDDSLSRAVIAEPMMFAEQLGQFTNVAPRHRHSVAEGFRRLWSEQKENKNAEWALIWPRLVDWFESVVAQQEFLLGADVHDAWFVSSIADLIQLGTKEDRSAYNADLLPRTWRLLEVLARIAKPVDAPSDNPMSQAINHPKGRVFQAVVVHLLRECRLAEKAQSSHAGVWDNRRPLLETELDLCKTNNYEAATLFGAYIVNLDYVSPDWIASNIRRIFPIDNDTQFKCAIGGLAYAAATSRLYALLKDGGVLEHALAITLSGRDTRQKLIERIMVAFVREEDRLDSPRVAALFNSTDDLEDAAGYLWQIRREKLKPQQRQLVIDFWRRAIRPQEGAPAPSSKTFAKLGHLTWALPDAKGEHRDMLLAVAPHIGSSHITFEFLDDLRRLIEKSPEEIGDVLLELAKSVEPFYDYKDNLKFLVERLATLGQRPRAIELCNKFRNVPGMRELHDRLTALGG